MSNKKNRRRWLVCSNTLEGRYGNYQLKVESRHKKQQDARRRQDESKRFLLVVVTSDMTVAVGDRVDRAGVKDPLLTPLPTIGINQNTNRLPAA